MQDFRGRQRNRTSRFFILPIQPLGEFDFKRNRELYAPKFFEHLTKQYMLLPGDRWTSVKSSFYCLGVSPQTLFLRVPVHNLCPNLLNVITSWKFKVIMILYVLVVPVTKFSMPKDSDPMRIRWFLVLPFSCKCHTELDSFSWRGRWLSWELHPLQPR